MTDQYRASLSISLVYVTFELDYDPSDPHRLLYLIDPVVMKHVIKWLGPRVPLWLRGTLD